MKKEMYLLLNPVEFTIYNKVNFQFIMNGNDDNYNMFTYWLVFLSTWQKLEQFKKKDINWDNNSIKLASGHANMAVSCLTTDPALYGCCKPEQIVWHEKTASRIKPASIITLWFLFQLVPPGFALSSCLDFPQCWSMTWELPPGINPVSIVIWMRMALVGLYVWSQLVELFENY